MLFRVSLIESLYCSAVELTVIMFIKEKKEKKKKVFHAQSLVFDTLSCIVKKKKGGRITHRKATRCVLIGV